MSIRAQILRTLKSKHLNNKELISYDIETYGDQQEFIHVGFYNPKIGYKVFYDKEEAIQWVFKVARKNKNLWFVATNNMFDFSEIFVGTKYWNNFSLCIKQGSLLLAKYTDPNKNFRVSFIDSGNYIGFSVKVMGEIIGLPKIKAPIFFTKKPKNDFERKQLEFYNQRDCEITYRFTKFLQESFKEFGGKTRLTAASTSMDIFRRKDLKKWIFKEDLVLGRNEKNTIHDFVFQSYYGGRTEVFKRGLVNGTLKVYDINSMYPQAMLNFMPEPSSVKHTHSPRRALLEFEGVSRVTLQAPDMYYPLLPHRLLNKRGEPEKLLFPTGSFTGVYTHVELRKALELGYRILKMYRTLYYKNTFKPFDSYVNRLYDAKVKYKEANSPMVHVAKLLLNSCYGKFAEKTAEENIIIDPKIMSREDFEKSDFGDLSITQSGFLMATRKKKVYKSHVIPIWASYITSYSRINLFSYLNKYKGYYVDTDSVATKKTMPTSNAIGAMKLEYDVKNAILVKPKMYMYDIVGGSTKIRLKGVSKVTREKFKEILEGKPVTYDKFTKLKEGLRRGIKPNSIQRVTKELDLEDTKRKWLNTFNPQELQDSEPLTISRK